MDSDYLLHLLRLLILKNTFFLLLLYIYGTLPFSHTLQKLAWLSAAAISQACFFFSAPVAIWGPCRECECFGCDKRHVTWSVTWWRGFREHFSIALQCYSALATIVLVLHTFLSRVSHTHLLTIVPPFPSSHRDGAFPPELYDHISYYPTQWSLVIPQSTQRACTILY